MDAALTHLIDELERIVGRIRELSGATGSDGLAPERSCSCGSAMDLYRQRRTRDRTFAGFDLEMTEPSWDILLLLYARQAAGGRVSVSALCTAGDIPPTTGLRHLGILQSRGLIIRSPDSFDRRRVWVELTDQGWSAMTEFLGGSHSEPRRLSAPDGGAVYSMRGSGRSRPRAVRG